MASEGCGIIVQHRMRISAPLTVLVLLLVVFTLPTFCAAAAASSVCAGAGEMAGSSPGSHCPGSRPASSQPRACCQVDHGTPMTVDAVRLVVPSNLVDRIVILDSGQNQPTNVPRFATPYGFSPPHPAVLRI